MITCPDGTAKEGRVRTFSTKHSRSGQEDEFLPFFVLGGDALTAAEIPDYLNDLNAMHEAEKVLTDDQLWKYSVNLHSLVKEDPNNRESWQFRATAAQRAEAFLRTLGLWVSHPTQTRRKTIPRISPLQADPR